MIRNLKPFKVMKQAFQAMKLPVKTTKAPAGMVLNSAANSQFIAIL